MKYPSKKDIKLREEIVLLQERLRRIKDIKYFKISEETKKKIKSYLKKL